MKKLVIATLLTLLVVIISLGAPNLTVEAESPQPQVISLQLNEEGAWVTVYLPKNLVLAGDHKDYLGFWISTPKEGKSVGRFLQESQLGETVTLFILWSRWDWWKEPAPALTVEFRNQEIFRRELPAKNPRIPTLHVVQKGNTVWELAKDYKSTVEKIHKLNQLQDPDLIYWGDLLIVQDGTWPPGEPLGQMIWIDEFFIREFYFRPDWGLLTLDLYLNGKFYYRYFEKGTPINESVAVPIEFKPNECHMIALGAQWENRTETWGGKKVCFEGFPERFRVDFYDIQINEKTGYIALVRDLVYTYDHPF